MTPITELTVTLDEAGITRLEQTVELMQRGDTSLSIDDCINDLFLIGLAQVHSTLTMTYLRKHMAAPAEPMAA